jgi:16S rRNA (cytidine1402-2'-O)-methyltransferase
LRNIPDRSGNGRLFVIATPIGNLADLSPRALAVLREVTMIACEDTRRTGRLLAIAGIKKPLISYFEHNEKLRTPELLDKLVAGADIGLVSDAGTPAISDPGFRLVRAAIDAGIKVHAVPGPSALIAALSIAGLPTDRFTFEGFLPARLSERRRALEALANEQRTMVFYEPARRLGETLSLMASIFGFERSAAVVRELTKTHEETVRGELGALAERYCRQPALGEVTIVVAGASEPRASDKARVTVRELCDAGLSLKDAVALLARMTGASRNEVYRDAVRNRAAGEKSCGSGRPRMPDPA